MILGDGARENAAKARAVEEHLDGHLAVSIRQQPDDVSERHVGVTVITKCLVSNVVGSRLPRQAACHIGSKIDSIGDWSALS